MKEAEFTYSLYVQANPVPDPDLLPLTRDEAALLSFERSPDMITEERAEKSQPMPPPPKRRRTVAALAMAAVLIGVIATVAIAVSGDSGPVAAADAYPAVVCDGTACSYEGPALIEEGAVEFLMTNSSTEMYGLHGWLMPDDAVDAELRRTPVGTDMDASGEPMPAGILWFSVYADAGVSKTQTPSLVPGTYLLDCKTESSNERVWRVARIEVVAAQSD